ncbi:hypothetical protein T05_500 [Trichinella murrelli]|uniref:Uncharacterized protein n=1 Tax=Trichinella murrelli TaxID=144512 RepID=A0A0V0UDK0_9BILA|nr:hypothetical protein T05_500 [Trichinella murrelli]
MPNVSTPENISYCLRKCSKAANTNAKLEESSKNYLLTNYDDSGLFSTLKLIKHWAISEYVRN